MAESIFIQHMIEGRKLLQTQIDELDEAVEKATGQTVKSVLLQERGRLQGLIDELGRFIQRINKIASGDTADSEAAPRVYDGQFANVSKLSVAVQCYLTLPHIRGGPVPIAEVVDALNEGGYRIHNKRAKNPEDKYKDVEGRHIRIMLSNDVHEKHPRSDGFVYGATYKKTKGGKELIALRNRKTDASEPPKKKDDKLYRESRHGTLNLGES